MKQNDSSVKVFAPCKINLSLNVVGVREDGYHQMEMVMQSLDFGDVVSLSLMAGCGITLSCDDPAVPLGEENIAHKAAVAILTAAKAQYGVHIHIEKKVPLQAGLGGGSADGAAVLAGINYLLGSPFSLLELCRIGAKIGADIPFCLVGGTQLVEGIGEVLTSLPPLPNCSIVLAKPSAGVPTAQCFQRYDQNPARGQGRQKQLLDGLLKQEIEQVGKNVFNVLEQAANLPEIALLKTQMLAGGALGSAMTGSGSAVFGIFTDGKQAQDCMEAIKRQGFFGMLTHPYHSGAAIQ